MEQLIQTPQPARRLARMRAAVARAWEALRRPPRDMLEPLTAEEVTRLMAQRRGRWEP